MSFLLGIRHIIRSLLHRPQVDAETREELEFHLERQTRKHINAGMSPGEALRRAQVELGGTERWREETDAVRRGNALLDAVADARYAWRGLAARQGFAATALATLVLGIGAATAVFCVADGALLRPLPFPEPDRIMSLSLRMPIQASGRVVDMVWSYPKFLVLRDQQRVFSALALHSSETLVVAANEGAERVSGETASAAYFSIVGARAAIGRTFTAQEDTPGSPRVVILSDGFWRMRFGGRANAIGEAISINGAPHTIVGVMPAWFAGLSGDSRLWIPIPAARNASSLGAAGAHNLQLIGRVADGVSPIAAREAVRGLGRRIDELFPADDGHWGAEAYAVDALRVNGTVRRSLQLLSIAVALLLAIVCVNLTTLLLTRGAARRQEFAIRLALGAARGRIVRQLVTESVVLAALGGTGGVLLAVLATRGLASTLPLSTPTASSGTDLTRLTFSTIQFDARAFTFALLLAAAIGICIGLVSAMRVTSSGFVALRQGAASLATGRPPRRVRLSGGLVVAQIALAVVLLVVSGLTIQSLTRTLAIPLGYEPHGLLTVKATLDPARAQRDSTDALWHALVREIQRLPGVKTVGLGSCSPLGMHCDGTSITPVGHAGATHVRYLTASPEYFAALGTPVLRGRTFEEQDVRRRVMIVNRSAARIVWGADDPLTTPVQYGDELTEIVGIVEDARYGDLEQPAEPAVFVPFRGNRGVIFARTIVDPASLGPAVRKAVRSVGSGHALGDMQTMTERLRAATVRNRLTAQVFIALAGTALLLAGIGVYGTLALRVSQRSRELAIRRALGADSSTLLRLVGAHAVTIVGAGAILGLGGAVLASRAVTALLYDVRPLEPSVYGVSGAVLLLAVCAAAAIPTARSLRIDPREAMRAE